MAAYFVCLDTCLLVTLYLRLRSGTEVKGFDELKALIEAKEATLVVPQVTILELEKFVDNAERELLSTVTRIESAIGNEGKHVKEELGKALAEPLKTWRKKKADDMRAVANGIFDWLKTGEPIKFTLEIAHETRCRTIAGKFPDPKLNQKPDSEESEEKKKRVKPEEKRDQDCFIIDSLISHFGGNVADRNLLIATTDNGFGPFGDDGTGPLDDTFQKGLPPARIFKDLSKLVAFVKEKKTVTLPTPDEVEAEKKREIKQELKFEQDAIAEVVKSGGRVFEIVVGDTVGAHDHPTVVVSGWLEGMKSQQRANENVMLRPRMIPGTWLGGAYVSPRLVAEAEPPKDDQPFFDTSNVPQSPSKLPVEGLQTFNGNLGDDEPKPEPENPPKQP